LGNREHGAVFRQSLLDFPCPVRLGEKSPSFGLHRYRQGLRFIPTDDEGFTQRGDKQRLLYKGRRRSHRFTILGDTAFEYDCILHREPESNVISLLIDGAENFDFFRQPDFVKDPFLKGSFAVYKKDTLVGEGTGKLCHIHRPLIIDARRRRCWGALAVVGNELRITIPEKWLSEAVYPVVVDPTVGTSTVGSQYLIEYDPPDDPWIQLWYEGQIPVNRFLAPDTINGLCTAYMYSNADNYDEAGGNPVIYSDNGNKPLTRKSRNENWADFTVNRNKPKGWRSATFESNGSIASGSYIWFGVSTNYYWEPRFDYGLTLYADFWDDENYSIPNTYPGSFWYTPDNFRLSMYFNFSSAQNYVCKLIQGVKLTDSKKIKADYKRLATQTVNGAGVPRSFVTFFRQFIMGVTTSMGLNRFPLFLRSVFEKIEISDIFHHSWEIARTCKENAAVYSDTERSQGFFSFISDIYTATANNDFNILFVRSVNETQGITDSIDKWADYIRGLFIEAWNIAETRHEAEYYRFTADTIQAAGSVLRGLGIFIRIVSRVLFRDYLLSRFLKAKTELILKSRIVREINLESRIN
jgi:hypothetical protein